MFQYNSIEDFNSSATYTFDKCDCGGLREMNLKDIHLKIGDYEIEVIECPILLCKKCHKERLGNLIPVEIFKTYLEMMKREVNGCRLTILNHERFNYAKDSDYNYDCRDLNIPGLHVENDFDHPDPGYSCPVFFEKKVLNNFLFDDEYELNLFSESYGVILKNGTEGWAYDWEIVFGINKNDKVIMFLGDLDQIDNADKSVYWLKAYNIPSDHQLVDTEMYAAQFKCIFSEPIMEKRILLLRNSFFTKIKVKYGIELFHLEDEVEELGSKIEKPVNYSEKEIKENIIILDGLLNEGINCSELRKLYEEVVIKQHKDYKNFKTRKLLEGIIAEKTSKETAHELVGSLFYLNDLRVCFAHLLPKDKVDEIKMRIINAFAIEDFVQYKFLYEKLLEKLYQLYQYLNFEEF